MPKTVTGPTHVLLVGGAETRHLRVPKQILSFGETTVLGRTLKAYLDAGFTEITLVLGYKADLIESRIAPLPAHVRIVRNPLFEEGMSSFLRAGLRELPSSAKSFCVGLCDQPLLTPELLKELDQAFQASEKPILIPVFEGSLGLPAFFAANLAEEMTALSPRQDLWDIVKRHDSEILDYPTGYTAVVRSIEDQEDYHALLRIAGLPVPETPPPPPPADPAPEPEEELARDPLAD